MIGLHHNRFTLGSKVSSRFQSGCRLDWKRFVSIRNGKRWMIGDGQNHDKKGLFTFLFEPFIRKPEGILIRNTPFRYVRQLITIHQVSLVVYLVNPLNLKIIPHFFPCFGTRSDKYGVITSLFVIFKWRIGQFFMAQHRRTEVWYGTDKEECRERLNRVNIFGYEPAKNKVFLKMFSQASQQIRFR